MEQLPQSLLTLGTLDDPYALFAEWREKAPVVRGPEGYAVTRYREVWSLMRDPRVTHRFPRHMLAFALGDGASTDFQTNSLLNREGDDHHRLRKLMNQAFHAGTVRQLRAHIGDLVDEALEPMLDGEARDLVDALAFPLPSAVICELLNIPMADRDEVRRRTADASTDNAASDAAITWLRDYMSGVLADRVPDPSGDLFQRMLAAEEDDDHLTHQEIVDNAILLFFAGFETTKNVIASGVVALDQFPAEQQKLWDNPELTPWAVEEFLRYDGPVRFSPRVALTDIDDIPAGSFVQLWLGSANHDPSQFDAPERLDIGREPNQHVAFGGGAHYCLGAMLARVEADVVFRRLATRVKRVELAGQPVRSTGGLGTYAKVPVTLQPA